MLKTGREFNRQQTELREKLAKESNIKKAFLILLFLMSACSSSGVKVDSSKLDQFTVGKSTCDDVLTALGNPTQRITAIGGKTGKDLILWAYSYSAAQSHPENFVPVIGAFIGGVDVETKSVGFLFYKNGCVLAKTSYSQSDIGSGTNLESVSQSRKDTRVVE